MAGESAGVEENSQDDTTQQRITKELKAPTGTVASSLKDKNLETIRNLVKKAKCYSYEFGKYHHDADLCEVITMTKWECKDNVNE